MLSLLVLALAEVVLVCWCYGIHNWIDNLQVPSDKTFDITFYSCHYSGDGSQALLFLLVLEANLEVFGTNSDHLYCPSHYYKHHPHVTMVTMSIQNIFR